MTRGNVGERRSSPTVGDQNGWEAILSVFWQALQANATPLFGKAFLCVDDVP